MKKNRIRGILYVLGVIALGYIVINIDWKEVYIHIRSLSPEFIILLLLLQCITMLLLTIQWKAMALNIKKEVSFLDMLVVNVKGNIVDAITPGVKAGGELARLYELRKRLKIELGNAAIIVGLQKSLSLISFLFLTLCSLIWSSFTMGIKYRYYLYVFSTVIILFTIFIAVLMIFSLKPDGMIKLLGKVLGNHRFMYKIDKTLREYSSTIRSLLKDKKKFFTQMMLAVFIWMFYAFKLSVVMRGFAIEMDYISIAAITFLVYMMGMIPILPGSIGSFETSMLALLVIRDIPMEVALSIAFVFRFITFWFEFILSLLILVVYNVFLFARKGDENVRVRV